MKLLKSESGAVLPMAMIMLMVGSILVVPLLQTVSTGSLIAKKTSFADSEDYAGDAGVEDAIWELLFNDLGASIPNENDSTAYTLGIQVNGETVDVTVTNLGLVIAEDDFETHTWSGGSGWAGSWVITGGTNINMSHQPYQGSHQVEIDDIDGSATRKVDLSDQPSNLRLQFWGKAHRMEAGDDVKLLVSPDGTQWFQAYIWTEIDSDNTDRFYDIDLTPYPLSNQFRISFNADNNEDDDEFFFDALTIIGPPRYEIKSNVGGLETKAVVSMDGGAATIISWE